MAITVLLLKEFASSLESIQLYPINPRVVLSLSYITTISIQEKDFEAGGVIKILLSALISKVLLLSYVRQTLNLLVIRFLL